MMHEVSFKLIELRVILIYCGECREIEVALLTEANDAEFIDGMPLCVIHAVSEGIEALSLPTELLYLNGRLGGKIEKFFQCHKLFVLCEPKVIAQSFDALLELRHRHQFVGTQFNDFGLAVNISNTI